MASGELRAYFIGRLFQLSAGKKNVEKLDPCNYDVFAVFVACYFIAMENVTLYRYL